MEQDFIRLYYIEGLKQKEIASKLNTSNSTISRFHTKLIEKLRRRLKSRFDVDL